MSKCVDCGSELDEGERYCQVCGSPTLVKPPTEKELRDMSNLDREGMDLRRRTKMILIAVILIILLIFTYFISKLVSQIGSMGGRL